jgi:NOL1/NOP2/fmu family ribosome biogenesis protein
VQEWSPENVQLCASRQRRIAADVWDALKQDGIFIYCTCTYNTLENEGTLKWIAENRAVEFLKIPTEEAWGVEEVNAGAVTAYRFFPHKTKGEGFFLSAMRKLDPVQAVTLRGGRALASPAKQVSARLGEWILRPEESSLIQFNDLVFSVPATRSADMQALLQRLRIVYAGTNLATLKHDKLIPEQSLALSASIAKENFPCVEVNEEDALRYLRRETIQISGQRGFALLTFHGLPIGWVNVLPNRVNNMYPAEWRIRMSGNA